jgi:hypothetical protein
MSGNTLGTYKGVIRGVKIKMDTPHQLAPAEAEFVSALRSIASKYGKLANGDGNGIWVGYESAAENENKEMGIKCSNCAFYESENVCQIIAANIEPDGYCRLAAIHDNLVKK